MCLGQKIKEFMQQNQILQNQISVTSHISTSKLNLALNGKRNLKWEEYETICWCLGVGVDKFLSPRPPETNNKGVQ